MIKRVCLGKITSAHGVKGLVKILPYGQDVELIEDLGPAYTSAEGDKTISVRIKNLSGSLFLAEIEGCNDRDKAEALRGTELYYDRDLLPEPEEGEIYYDDLVGLQAVENGNPVGSVIAVTNFGASDLLEIQPVNGGKAYYLPYTDYYVGAADLDAGTIEVFHTAEMIDS